jgi:hypothetical protein|tara:strand:+ start:1449 stop:1853 length:405 start_codon:yes stop_codon:yes gene_type:complete
MPLQRVSQGFKDISMTFQTNPLTKDLIALTNVSAINRSLKNIVFTYPGEKFFDPEFGSKISRVLFDNIDPINAIRIKAELKYSITRYEPRVRLIAVNVNPDYEQGSFDVVIIYEIIGIPASRQDLSFVLQSTSQ